MGRLSEYAATSMIAASPPTFLVQVCQLSSDGNLDRSEWGVLLFKRLQPRMMKHSLIEVEQFHWYAVQIAMVYYKMRSYSVFRI